MLFSKSETSNSTPLYFIALLSSGSNQVSFLYCASVAIAQTTIEATLSSTDGTVSGRTNSNAPVTPVHDRVYCRKPFQHDK
jgi:hypothetical protein